MLKGWFSSNRLRLLLLVVLLDDAAVQKPGRSGGDGWTKTPLSLISIYSIHGQLDHTPTRRGAVRLRDSPLNWYSTGAFSLTLTGLTGDPLVCLSTPLLYGRAFSSCLRNGLRMMYTGVRATSINLPTRILFLLPKDTRYNTAANVQFFQEMKYSNTMESENMRKRRGLKLVLTAAGLLVGL